MSESFLTYNGQMIRIGDSSPSLIKCVISEVYQITCNLTGCTASPSNPTTIMPGTVATLTFIANTGYEFPSSITVSGADSAWVPSTGTLTLSNATANVSITIVTTAIVPYLTIWCPESFILGSYNSSSQSFIKGWDGTLQYSTNTTTWTTWSGTSGPISSAKGSDNNYYLYLRGTGNTYLNTESSYNACMFVFYKSNHSAQASNVHLVGNMEVLLDYQQVLNNQHPTLGHHAFSGLFQYQLLVEAPRLGSLILSSDCYMGMFFKCTSLATAPALPATTLAEECYCAMFAGCTSLTMAPALPATILAYACYYRMFYECTSLTTAPALPATTLANNCYYSMFSGCTSLVTAPALPATTLADYCYSYMFEVCTSLQVYSFSESGHTCAWRLPTTGTGYEGTLSTYYMFYECPGNYSTTANVPINTTFYTQNPPIS